MQPAERHEGRIVERLYAKRYTVDPGPTIAAKAHGLDAGRIGFERYFDIGRNRPVPRDCIENAANDRRSHQGRRAAADEDG